jgi:hypothetical protein
VNDRYVQSSFEFTVYNRWGEMVFQSFNDQIGWDGTYGSGLNFQVQEGVYTWVVRLKMKENEEAIRYTGHVSLLK